MRAHLHERNGSDTDAALRILHEAQAASIELSIWLYNLLFASYGRSGRTDEFRKLRREMAQAGIEPDVVTYTTMISALGRKRHFHRAEIVFREMQQRNIEPNEKVYGAMLDIYSQSHRMKGAEAIFREHCVSTPRQTHIPRENHRKEIVVSVTQRLFHRSRRRHGGTVNSLTPGRRSPRK